MPDSIVRIPPNLRSSMTPLSCAGDTPRRAATRASITIMPWWVRVHVIQGPGHRHC